MMDTFHFLRPWWLLTLIPLFGCIALFWRKRPALYAWEEICDPHLLSHLLQKEHSGGRALALSFFLISILWMVVSLAGPAWQKLPVPTYKTIQPRVLILDLSDHMLESDLTPNRLARAKFKIHDLLSHKAVGQFGMIVYTEEPFVVSPLTEDGETINSLLTTLSPEIMPVEGQKLEAALKEGAALIRQAGYKEGNLMVLTADSPSIEAIDEAKRLAGEGISSSIMPMRADKYLNPLFARFAQEGHGHLLPYTPGTHDLEQWISNTKQDQFARNQEDDIPVWRDEGRWFLIPALLFLLPMFQRGWLQRMV